MPAPFSLRLRQKRNMKLKIPFSLCFLDFILNINWNKSALSFDLAGDSNLLILSIVGGPLNFLLPITQYFHTASFELARRLRLTPASAASIASFL